MSASGDDPVGGSQGPAGEGGASAGKGSGPALPPASFSTLVAGIAIQVQVGLGMRPNPITNATEKSLDAAKHGIDLLETLEAKTKGNLDASEIALLSHLLWDLRMAYVEARRKA